MHFLTFIAFISIPAAFAAPATTSWTETSFGPEATGGFGKAMADSGKGPKSGLPLGVWGGWGKDASMYSSGVWPSGARKGGWETTATPTGAAAGSAPTVTSSVEVVVTADGK